MQCLLQAFGIDFGILFGTGEGSSCPLDFPLFAPVSVTGQVKVDRGKDGNARATTVHEQGTPVCPYEETYQ